MDNGDLTETIFFDVKYPARFSNQKPRFRNGNRTTKATIKIKILKVLLDAIF
jgi:hypothetical protein